MPAKPGAAVDERSTGHPDGSVVDDRPPGERYYRHPGDVVRLVVWATASAVLLLFITVATTTSDGVRVDLGGAATSFPDAVRQLLLASVQIAAVVTPIAVLVAIGLRRRWRRLATIVGAAIAGAGVWTLLAMLLDEVPAIGDALEGEAWLGAARFPSLAYVAAAVAAGAVGKPWLSRRWRRVVDGAGVVLAVSMAVAGLAGAAGAGARRRRRGIHRLGDPGRRRSAQPPAHAGCRGSGARGGRDRGPSAGAAAGSPAGGRSCTAPAPPRGRCSSRSTGRTPATPTCCTGRTAT